jgi:hypothetical protein
MAGGRNVVRLPPPVLEALIGPPRIYPTALHVVSTSMLHRGVWFLLCRNGPWDMQDPVYGLPRTPLPRRWVNKPLGRRLVFLPEGAWC